MPSPLSPNNPARTPFTSFSLHGKLRLLQAILGAVFAPALILHQLAWPAKSMQPDLSFCEQRTSCNPELKPTRKIAADLAFRAQVSQKPVNNTEAVHPYLVGLPPFLFINMDRSVERRRHVESSFRRYGMHVTRIPAFDGTFIFGPATGPNTSDLLHNATLSGVGEGLDGRTAQMTLFNQTIRVVPGNDNVPLIKTSVVMSHMRAAEYIIVNNLSSAIVFEDDVSLEWIDFWGEPLANMLSRKPDDAALVLLQMLRPNPEKLAGNNTIEYLYHADGITDGAWGATAYWMSREGAELFLGGMLAFRDSTGRVTVEHFIDDVLFWRINGINGTAGLQDLNLGLKEKNLSSAARGPKLERKRCYRHRYSLFTIIGRDSLVAAGEVPYQQQSKALEGAFIKTKVKS